MASLTPKDWNCITKRVEVAVGRMELSLAKERVRRAKETLAQLRKKYAHPGRQPIKPTGNSSVSLERIREVVRKHK